MPHLVNSVRRNSPKAFGSVATTSVPDFWKALRTSAVCISFVMSPCRRLMIGAGVPAGARKPVHNEAS
ncbi:hypothetical protein D3C83_97700 [compost metagenome]